MHPSMTVFVGRISNAQVCTCLLSKMQVVTRDSLMRMHIKFLPAMLAYVNMSLILELLAASAGGGKKGGRGGQRRDKSPSVACDDVVGCGVHELPRKPGDGGEGTERD